MSESEAKRQVDPTVDRDPKNWIVEADPPPDVDLVTFANGNIGYLSYNPPRGFSAEEIMQFENASELLTLEEVEALIRERNEKGTLEAVYNG